MNRVTTLARVSELARVAERLPPAARRAGGDQLVMALGQLGAGAGNLAFTLVMARVLAPGAFAQLTAFLALYLLVNLPMASITAGATLAPDGARALRARVRWASAGIGAVLLAASPVLAPLLHLPVILVLALGLSAPCAGPLALERGRLYGRSRHLRIVASMLAEPAVRLSLGVALALSVGAVGGALGVMVAGYAALEIARNRLAAGRHSPGRAVPAALLGVADLGEILPAQVPGDLSELAVPTAPARGSVDAALWTTGAFLVLAVIQNQDLLLANRLLGPAQAGSYGALSTLGGAAAFATATIPLVLLPGAARGRPHALAAALSAAAALGGGAVAVAALFPHLVTSSLFGTRYGGLAGLAVPYVGAMALLGLARVLVAYRCALGSPRTSVAILAAVAAGQAITILAVGHSVRAIAFTTLGATAALTAALALAAVPGLRPRGRTILARVVQPAPLAVTGLLVAGLAIRLVIPRGIWIDEATSIHDATLGWWAMIDNLRNTDVHPPLYLAILWVTVRLASSTASLVVRLPGIIFGALTIPMAYATARRLWDRRTGVVAAALCTAGPLLIWYSQEARMYSLFMLLALMAVWAQVMALRDGRARYWVAYALASAGLGWNEYFGLLQVMAQQMAFAGWFWMHRHQSGEAALRTRRAALGWLASSLGILVLLAPLVPFAFHQFAVNQALGKGFGSTPSQITRAGPAGLSFYAVLANLVWAIWGYHSTPAMAALVAMWPVGILVALFVLGRKHQASTSLVLVCIAVPTAVLIGAGSIKPDLFDIRYLSGAVVLLMCFLARMLTGALSRPAGLRLATLALVGTMSLGLFDQQVNGANPRRYDFRSALALVDQQYRPQDLLVYDPQSLDLVVEYYSGHLRRRQLKVGNALIPPGVHLFVLASNRLMQGSDKAVLAIDLTRLEGKDHLVEKIDRANVEVWEFTARSTAGAQP